MVAPQSRTIDVARWHREHVYRVVHIDGSETVDLTFDFSGELTTGDDFDNGAITAGSHTQVGSAIDDSTGKTVTFYVRGPLVADGTESVITCEGVITAYGTTLTSVGACIVRQRNN